MASSPYIWDTVSKLISNVQLDVTIDIPVLTVLNMYDNAELLTKLIAYKKQHKKKTNKSISITSKRTNTKKLYSFCIRERTGARAAFTKLSDHSLIIIEDVDVNRKNIKNPLNTQISGKGSISSTT